MIRPASPPACVRGVCARVLPARRAKTRAPSLARHWHAAWGGPGLLLNGGEPRESASSGTLRANHESVQIRGPNTDERQRAPRKLRWTIRLSASAGWLCGCQVQGRACPPTDGNRQEDCPWRIWQESLLTPPRRRPSVARGRPHLTPGHTRHGNRRAPRIASPLAGSPPPSRAWAPMPAVQVERVHGAGSAVLCVAAAQHANGAGAHGHGRQGVPWMYMEVCTTSHLSHNITAYDNAPRDATTYHSISCPVLVRRTPRERIRLYYVSPSC